MNGHWKAYSNTIYFFIFIYLQLYDMNRFFFQHMNGILVLSYCLCTK